MSGLVGHGEAQRVGGILLKVKEDLVKLRDGLTHIRIHGDGEVIDIQALDSAILKTETRIQCYAEECLDSLNSQVLTLPSLDETGTQREAFIQSDPLSEALRTLRKPSTGREGRALESHSSPGVRLRQAMEARILSDPENPQNRPLLWDTYGIQLPTVRRREAQLLPGRLLKRGIPEPLSGRPPLHRGPISLPLPPIPDKDGRGGGEHLGGPRLEASWTQPPQGSSSAPLPTSRRGQRLARARTQEPSREPAPAEPSQLQPTTPASEQWHRLVLRDGRVDQTAGDFSEFQKLHRTAWGPISSTLRGMEGLLANAANAAAASTPSLSSSFPPPLPASRAGLVAVLRGERVAQVAQELELGLQRRRVTERDLLFAAENPDSLLPLLGRRFRSPGGHDRAATRIQASWRAFLARRHFERHRRRRWAAGVVAVAWMLRVQRGRVRRSLAQRRQAQLENFRTRAQYLAENWKRIQSSRRTIIHIPSLGYSKHLRRRLKHFDVLQNLQMGRLCDIKDPNVDVIYVSPVPLSDEVLHYYERLLGLSASGGDGTGRYTIIVPDAVVRFPQLPLSLASLLEYSPGTLRRIRALVSGREAYVVPGGAGEADLAVADELGLPALAPEPTVARLCGSKSEARRIFSSAGVATPPGEEHIRSMPQLVESLSRLVAAHAGVRCWLLKTEEGPGGRGTASCPVAQHLPCHRWVLSESRRYGSEQWRHRWAQDAAVARIAQELPELLETHCVLASNDLYPDWASFIQAFLCHGGVIEACPPGDSLTCLTVDLLLEPSGDVAVQAWGDQLGGRPVTPALRCWGSSLPQSSVEPGALHELVRRVAQACCGHGFVGHLSVDFVTFIDPESLQQQVWALDLDVGYSDQLAMTRLMEFVTGGGLDWRDSIFSVPSEPTPESGAMLLHGDRAKRSPPASRRYAVTSTQLVHSNLALLHYSVFFKMCRAHGIGFDVKERQGTVFTLIHGQRRERLGMMVIMDDLQVALMTFAQNLALIHQQISSADMQGETNFKEAVQEIESILGITVQNWDREEKERESGGQLADHTKATTTVTATAAVTEAL
ncbi:IQ domain-containing protein H isoform X1 [Petromyzon marinus]|uniref:IQ domain-containing protein H isoform X1 n=1 Tax=Petromyzon marinus TaxID=7757 RepID=UPI003F722D30